METATLIVPVDNELHLQTENGQVVVSSRVVAERFKKRHSHVVEAIENKVRNLTAENSEVNLLRLFIPTTYTHNGNDYKEYLLTRDGFTFIVMGFTGAEADMWKLKYIEAFNKMEQALNQPRRLTPQEELRLHYQVLEEQAKEIESVREEVTEVREEFKDLKDNMPLFGEESDKLQAEVRKVGVATLGGYKSNAYNDNSLRGKVYKDIQNQLRREFGVERYKAIKRCQLDLAMKIVHNYKAPTVLVTEISNLNNQMRLA